ncbi:helix-turn-helix domain-containing protein [Chryseobacterium sp. FH1]|uniref:helix-turn-helix domain-containing protein n=1 Tax=Chryseobacterium sp. FH1 TaxID=1233951 RepID=UPI0004E369DB|nr:helix-turn-helix domain-containing protein [Chryseobacterium sp. FH1]KFC18469.1 hypothetical protein IO90_18365 [Chryseobacterium sp. FH1]
MKPNIILFIIFSLFIKAQNTQDAESLSPEFEGLLNKESKVLALSDNYLKQNLYKEAIKSLFQAKKMSETSQSENFKAYTYILLANFYRGLELNKIASENIEMAMTPLSAITDSKEQNYIEARFQLEKGLLNFALSKDDEGKTNLWKSSAKFRQIDDPKKVSKSLQFIYSKLGDYYLSQNELDSAKHYFNQNLKLSNQFPTFKDLELRAKNGLSSYYLQNKQTDSALYFVSGLTKDLPKVKDLLLKKDVYKNLAQIHYSADDLENYKILNEQYLKLNDSIYESNQDTRVLLANEADSVRVENPDSNKSSLWILITLGVALAGLALAYANHIKVKKEYVQFQKIMQNLNETKNLKSIEIHEVNSDNLYIISEKTEQIILDKLKKFEEGEKYINPKVSLQFLAKNLDTNTKYLSEIINKKKGQNFNNYINELRIHYIIRKLKSEPKYQNYKVSSLAEECGFNSRNTFTLAFKNTLGISPTNFIGFIKKENSAHKSLV